MSVKRTVKRTFSKGLSKLKVLKDNVIKFLLAKWNLLKEKWSQIDFMTVRRVFWVAVGILGALLLTSVVVLAVRLGSFSSADKREVSLSSKIHDDRVDIFDMQYENADGEITVAGMDGEKVLAPGTKVEYTIRIRNTDSVAIDYQLGSDLVFDSKLELPIVVRMLDPNDEYILGDEKTWVGLSELKNLNYSHTLLSGEAAEYVFQWKWPFEGGDDEYDTFLGDQEQDISLQVSLSIQASANTTISGNGGWVKSGAIYNVALILLALLLAGSIVLLLLTVVRKKVIPAIVEVVAPAEPEITPVAVSAPQLRVREHWEGKMVSVNLDVLQNHFRDGDEVSLRVLKRKGLLPGSAKRMKVLAHNGYKLDKALTVRTQAISAQARMSIIEAGGSVIIAKE